MKLLQTGAEALGIHLSLAQMQRFRQYYEELTDWNTRVNLTSVTGWREVQARHFVDSLTVSLAIPPDLLESGRFVDVGSGAGFPGVPLKIAFPGLRPTLVEATARKAAFLSALKDVLGLADVDVRTGRGETLAHDPELRGGFDFALVRAVGSMAVLAEVALPFCRVGGIVVAQKKRGIEGEIARARRAFETMGGRVIEVRDVTEVAGTEYLGEDRSLVILEKVGPTPDKYPRRPGMPAKRPI